jgi:hypothetical protein
MISDDIHFEWGTICIPIMDIYIYMGIGGLADYLGEVLGETLLE